MHKYDSFRLDDYTLNPLTILNNYTIQDEKYKTGYIVSKGVSKGTSQRVKIYKRPFIDSPASRRRFLVLMKAFRRGIIFAENIFLSNEKENYYLYIIEPDYSSSKCEYHPLSNVIKGEELDYLRKQRLFQSLLLAIKELHNLGEANLEISPTSVLVKDQLEIRLKPFKLDILGHNITFGRDRQPKTQVSSVFPNPPACSDHTAFWYTAPEQLFKDSKSFYQGTYVTETESSMYSNTMEKSINDFASDMWSLGCIFAEMFVTLTPIFQAVDSTDTATKFFQVLGIPQPSEVYYINPELYRHLVASMDQEPEFPLISELVQNLSKNEAQILTSLLNFNPNKRPTPNLILDLPFFKAYTPQKYRQKSAVSLLEALQNHEHSPLPKHNLSANKKSRENLSLAYNSLSRSSNRRQSASRESIVKQRPSVIFSRSNSTFNSIPVNQGDWWNSSIVEAPQENLDNSTMLERSSHNYRSSPLVKERSRLSSVKKTLDFTEEPEMETLQTFSDREQTGHFEIQESPSYYSSNIQHSDTSMSILRSENRKRQQAREFPSSSKIHNDYDTALNSSTNQRPSHYDEPIEPNTASTYKRKSLINIRKDCNSTPVKSPNQIFKRTRVEQRKDEHEEQMQYLQSQKKAPRPQKSMPEARAKLSVDIETIKVSRFDIEASYGCRVILKNKNNDHLSKEKIDLFSCFAPLEDFKVKLDFKGEAELSAESFLQMYSKESLEIQVFHQRPLERGQYIDTDSEATIYGVSRINLGLVLPQLYNLIGQGTPIRARRDWYVIYDPKRPREVVGKLKLALSVDFTGNINQYKHLVNHEYTTPRPKQQKTNLDERLYASQLDSKENQRRRSLAREIDFLAEAGGNLQKQVQKRPTNIPVSPNPKIESGNMSFGHSRAEKKAQNNVSALDFRSKNLDSLNCGIERTDQAWGLKKYHLRANRPSQRLEM